MTDQQSSKLERNDDTLLQLSHWARNEKNPEALLAVKVNLYLSLIALGDWPRARAVLDELMVLAPDDHNVQIHQGSELIRAGKVREGMSWYDKGRWRFSGHDYVKRNYPFPLWGGEALNGKKLLVWAEQGVGDQIMQSRVVPALLEAGAEVTVECDKRLIPLFERAMPNARYQAQKVRPAANLLNTPFDFQTSMWSAWRWASTGGDFQRSLAVDPIIVENFKATWAGLDGHGPRQKNVGISWSSRAASDGAARSLSLKNLQILPLIGAGKMRFHNLQYGERDSKALSAEFNAPLWTDPATDPLVDLDRAAAQIAALDLVITIDNTTAHMAGALGIPTWLLLRKNSNFRWGEKGGRAQLYPSVRLFRASDVDRWAPQVLAVAEALERGLKPERQEKSSNNKSSLVKRKHIKKPPRMSGAALGSRVIVQKV